MKNGLNNLRQKIGWLWLSVFFYWLLPSLLPIIFPVFPNIWPIWNPGEMQYFFRYCISHTLYRLAFTRQTLKRFIPFPDRCIFCLFIGTDYGSSASSKLLWIRICLFLCYLRFDYSQCFSRTCLDETCYSK